jgi:hypothetical protein
MEESMFQRRVDRTAVVKDARIILCRDVPAVVECIVINVTNLGACLEVAETSEIPNSFDLTFDSARSFRRCRVIWKAENTIGISFE